MNRKPIDDEEYFARKIEIRRAAEKALRFLGLNWRVDVSYNGLHKWEVDFYDEDHHHHGPVSFIRPPNANEDWYAQEIIRQLQAKLGNNN